MAVPAVRGVLGAVSASVLLKASWLVPFVHFLCLRGGCASLRELRGYVAGIGGSSVFSKTVVWALARLGVARVTGGSVCLQSRRLCDGLSLLHDAGACRVYRVGSSLVLWRLRAGRRALAVAVPADLVEAARGMGDAGVEEVAASLGVSRGLAANVLRVLRCLSRGSAGED